MKKTFIFFAFVSLAFLLACSANNNDVNTDMDYVTTVSLTIVENSLTRSSVSTVATAPAGYEIERWFDFHIEKQTTEGWSRLPMILESIVSNDIAPWLARNATEENIEKNFGMLPNGHYRIIVQMFMIYPYSADFFPYYEFTITDDTPER